MDSFSNLVKHCGVEKLQYSVWKTLHNWATKPDWSEDKDWEICICGKTKPDIIDIYPWHELYLTPEVVTIVKSSSFGQFLLETFKEEPEFAKMETTSTHLCNSLVSETNHGLYEDNLILNNNDITAQGTDNYYWTTDGTNINFCGDTLSSTTNVNFNTESLTFDDESLSSCIEKIVKRLNEKEKENKNMTFGNFDFGPVDSSVHMSMYGLAIKNASNTYVSYDVANKQIVDVDILNFDGAQKFMYKMPVAIKDIAVGDVVVHARKPMFVVAVRKDGKLAVVDPYAGEEKVIMLTKSPFGFDFATKVISFLNFGTVDSNNPFGNMLPFLLMSDNKNVEDMLPFMFMMNSQGTTNNFAFNPMLMYAVFSKDNKMKDFLPFLFMMNQPTHTCTCNCHTEDNATQE